MIMNTHQGRRAWMRKALVAPVVAGAVLFFACSKDQAPQAARLTPSQPIIQADGNAIKTFRIDDAAAVKLNKIELDSRMRIPITMGMPGKITLDLRSATFQVDSLKFEKARIVPDGNRIGVKN